MIKELKLKRVPDLPEELKEAGLNGELVLFVGAGVSRCLGLPSWKELAELILNDLQEAGVLNFAELEQLKTLDPNPKQRLSIAELIIDKWNEKNPNKLNFYSLIKKNLKSSSKESKIYSYINDIGCACVTTNYDEFLSPKLTNNNSTIQAPTKRIFQTDDFYASHLNSPGTVIHLHGMISEPSSIIATTKRYLEHYDKEEVRHFLSELFEKKTVLFIGYGLEEIEVLEHILRHSGARKSSVKEYFALLGFFQSERLLYRSLHEYYLESFGVRLIGFNRDYKNHSQLEEVVKKWSKSIKIRLPALINDLMFMDEVLQGA